MDGLLDIVIASAPQWGTVLCYALICVPLIFGGLGLPLPEDIPLLAAGVLCYLGLAQLPTMIAVTFCVVLGADFLVFYLGRRYGHHVPRMPMVRYYLTPARLARAQQFFESHGGKTLFVARFLPGLRSAVWFSAGACRTRWWKMMVYDGSAALLSVPAVVLLGFFGATQIDQVKHWTRLGRTGVAVLLIVVVAVVVTYKLIRRRKAGAAKQPSLV